MDQAPGGNRWREMLTDARQLEWHVSQVWASTIVHGDTLRRSSSRPSPV